MRTPSLDCLHGSYFNNRVHSRSGRFFRHGERGIALVIVVSLVLGLFLQTTTPLFAQPAEPWFRITGINVDNFPEVKVTVYGENLGMHLAQVPMVLQEDNVPQEAPSQMEATGAQTLLVIDVYTGMRENGPTGKPIIQEVVAAINQLTEQQYLLADKDWLGFVSFDNSGSTAIPEIFSTWNNSDHQAVLNEIARYSDTQMADAKSRTSLYDLLYKAIYYFDDLTPPQNLPRSIVIFSDGRDSISISQKEDLIRLANERNIRIHTVQYGRSPGPEADRNLQNLALTTQGRFFRLNEEDPNLTALWENIRESQQQRVFTYRSSKPHPDSITIIANVNNRRLPQSRAFPDIDVRPPQIVITQPTENSLERVLPDGSSLRYDTPATALEPKTLDVVINVAWLDGFPRNLHRVEYIMGNRTITRTSEPFDAVSFPIENFENDSYTLRVIAIDELGLRGEAAPKPFSIVINRPAPPDFDATSTAVAATVTAEAAVAAANANATATQASANALATTQALETRQAAAAATAQKELENAEATRIAQQAQSEAVMGQLGQQNQLLQYATTGGIALSALTLLFAIYVWFNPRARKRATEIVSGTIARMTELWSPSGGSGPVPRVLKARLYYVGGSESPLKTIDLYGGNARIGRDSALANIVIPDRRVSRYHGRISEESPGVFRIFDEGSTSGTYVNNTQVTMSGQPLRHGDLINFGPVQFRFESLDEATYPVTEGGVGMDGATEMYIPGGQTAIQTEYGPGMTGGATQVTAYDAGGGYGAGGGPDAGGGYGAGGGYAGGGGYDDVGHTEISYTDVMAGLNAPAYDDATRYESPQQRTNEDPNYPPKTRTDDATRIDNNTL